MNLPAFKGLGSEDPDQFWFVTKTLWMAHNITNDHIKKAQLVTTLQDHAFAWYIKYCTDNPLEVLANTQTALNKEFDRPKSESQLVIGFKENMMRSGETPWELDQRVNARSVKLT